ncbi:glycoside hydrolase family 19 protein [Streptomyces tirandamycinicus]|uniref:Chitinase n=1 Tax=Streptomyces tirandamycinicus TaxID=2174846 RepID=A0A2S1SPJ6_9ACTN|nr:glycoside hydrolase family 19 protein [Streptomyces tirandamycinicus]AWI28314.1 chitinase [Streptomyces tirandamycinicus]MCY0983820.1 chitinase [Streptomyces tirandamycinicus]
MSRRIIILLAAFAAVLGLTVLVPSTASAAACAAAWNSSSVYTGGMTASHNGRNWQAKWWTQNETPGSAEVWADQGACGGGGGNPNPDPSGFVVSEAQFNQMFPNRNAFYTYSGLTSAMSAYPAFAKTGSDTVRKQEAAAFLANVAHETGGLVHIVEQNTANYPHYCDRSQPYGCPAGQAAYYGRGPIQLSWNFNYKAAGDALGIDLLGNPWRVERESAVAWKTGLWYWNTQSGPGTMTGHNAMVNQAGFGHTIRSINGSLECDGKNPAQVQSRVNNYQRFTQILGVPTGGNLYC